MTANVSILALAGDPHQAERDLVFVLVQLALILVCARLLGNVARRLGQPRVVGEIVGGLALGPSLLGALAPGFSGWLFHSTGTDVLYAISQVGLIFLMLQIGMEFDFGHLRERVNRRAVLAVTAGSVALPLAGGFGIAWVGHPALAPEIDRLSFSLFVSVALSITALPILGRIMVDFGLSRTRLGSVTISSAALNDVIGWLLLAAITAAVTSRFSPGQLGLQAAGLAGLCLVAWFGVRPVLRRLARSQVERAGEVGLGFAAGLSAAALLAGVATIHLGVFAIFGGFVIGVLLHDERRFSEAWERRMGPFVEFFFLPVFFTYTGLRTDAGGLGSPGLWLWWLAITGLAIATKLAGAWIGARLAGIRGPEARCIAVMMNTRALMELVVLNVGYELGVIPATVFTMLVFMAIATTVVTAPLLRWLLPAGLR